MLLALEVTEEAIALEATGREGFLRGVELLRQLESEEGFVGVRVGDWPAFPTRELLLPWPTDAIAPGFWPRLLANLAWCGYNRLSLLGDAEGAGPRIEEGVLRRAAGFGIEIGYCPADAPPFLAALAPSEGGVVPLTRLRALAEEARAALAAGEKTWRVAVSSDATWTPLETLWHGIAFAGACGWNPAKADLNALRRTFAARFFGSEAAAVQEAIETLAEVSLLPTGVVALFEEDPAAPHLWRRLPGAAARVEEVRRHAEAALTTLTTLKPRATRNQQALAALEWTARRLAVQTGHALAMERARELYREALEAQTNARTVLQKTLRTAELLEAEVDRIAALQPLLEQVWRQERAGDPPAQLSAPDAARAGLLRALARQVREARDTYIQTGTLPEAAEVGLAAPGSPVTVARHPGRVVAPRRLPPRHSPAWWPEGGEARLRVEVRGGGLALPWEVAVDLRAWAGEEGAFHIGHACLVPYDDATDAVGAPVPCQLTRTGFVFVPTAGAFFLYLERRGVSGRREEPEAAWTGARQRARPSSGAISIDGPLFRARIEREHGLLDRWTAYSPATPDVSEAQRRIELAAAMGVLADMPDAATRVRVLENGPLLIRVQAEDPNGRVRQYDFPGGVNGWEWAMSTPVAFVGHALRAEPWQEAVALFPSDADGAARTRPLDKAEATALWAARLRPDGLLLACLSPERPAHHRLTLERHDIEGEPDFARLFWWLAQTDGTPDQARSAADALDALLCALRKPPTVQLGPVEERRTREF